MAASCTAGNWCTIGWFAAARSRRSRWVTLPGLHTARIIPVSWLIQRKLSNRLNRGFSWLSVVPLGGPNSASWSKLISCQESHTVRSRTMCIRACLFLRDLWWLQTYGGLSSHRLWIYIPLEPPPQRYIHEWDSLSWSVFFQPVSLSLEIAMRSGGASAFSTFRLRTKARMHL